MSGAEPLSRGLVRAVLALRAEDLPDAVRKAARRSILDTLLVAWAGAGVGLAPSAAALTALVRGQGGRAEASVWGGGPRLPMPAAAFLNALHASLLDYDSLNGAVHADAVVLPAAWAVAEARGASGVELLTAYVVGAEVTARLARAAPERGRGWSRTPLYGVFGAATAAGLLLGLDADGLTRAFGHALGRAAGTQQGHVEQALSKHLQPAFAARDGLFAAQLAAAGVGAPALVLEGPFGLGALYEPLDGSALLDGFGRHFAFLDTGLKGDPVCAGSLVAMDACRALLARHALSGEEVVGVEAVVSPLAGRLVGGGFNPEGDPAVTAQFSLRYALATLIRRGGFGLADLRPEAVRDPRVAPLADAMVIRVDPAFAGLAPAEVRLLIADGRRLVERREHWPGSAAAPLDRAALRRKHEGCAAAGPEPRPAGWLDRVERAVAGLERAPGLNGFWPQE
ncbi:2-methylcitrate dehydratase PrpD [Azospirillum baldaniorum]|uniref:MmgE/PrpD family protein n=1 Tax=Azospirillum baldaniorum TaxID=1064539 RepID=UPI0011A05DF4|nr:MmgE/PrpD family protein [Azospirillum baldaniorum]TWA57335.1 2-methylcitrate dehydratase PrpD [Azospirillum baldaniorum]